MKRPFQPDDLRLFIGDKMAEYWESPADHRRPFVGALIGHIEKAIKETLVGATKEDVADIRHRIFGFVFDRHATSELSAKDLMDDELYALENWINVALIDNTWLPDLYLTDEIRFLIWRLL